jgi:hypothetical protein
MKGIGISIGMGKVEVDGKACCIKHGCGRNCGLPLPQRLCKRWERRLRGVRERRGKGKAREVQRRCLVNGEMTKRFAR